MQERLFREWYAEQAQKSGIAPDPDDPLHKYDYRGAFLSGATSQVDQSDGLPHWPSSFKDDDHPNRFVRGVGDTRSLDRGLGPTIPTNNPNLDRQRKDLAKIQSAIREGRLPPEAMQRYIERERVTPEMEAAKEPLGIEGTIKGAIANAGEGVGFSLADELMGGLRGAVDPRITMGEGIDEVRSERDRFAAQHPKTALGLTLGGAVLPAVLTAGMAGAGAPSIGRVAATTGAQGAVAGYGSGEGGPLSGSRIARGVGYGLAGAGLGAGVARVANSRAGDTIARKGGDVLEMLQQMGGDSGNDVAGLVARGGGAASGAVPDAATSGALRSIAARTGGAAKVPEARNVLAELEKAGLGEPTIAADVLPGGPRELRRAFNVSPTAASKGRTQLLERGANVGTRSRTALTEATGLSPQTTAAGVDDLVAQRAAKAKPTFAAAESEGVANRMTPRTPAMEAWLNEPDIKSIADDLLQTRQYRGRTPDDPEVVRAIYRVLSDRQGTLKASQLSNPKNLGRIEGENLSLAKRQGMDAIAGPDGPMPSFRPANENFADASRLKEAYESGVAMFNKPVGDIQAAMAKMTPDELDVFKRGAFDALLEKRVGPASPNAGLGEFARQSKRAGQATVDTDAAAARVRAVFGEDEYQKVLAAARGEGRFTQTATDALGGSTTAQQLGDMGLFGQLAQDAAGGSPTTVRWWANAADKARKFVDEPASRRAAELLTGKPKTLLEYLEQMATTDASRRSATSNATGVALRTQSGRP